jgi:hypothetical protein
MTLVAQGSISERGEVHTQVRLTQSRVSTRKSHHENIKASRPNQSYPTISLVKLFLLNTCSLFAYTDLNTFFTRASTDQKGERSADVTPVHALQHLTRLFFFQPQHTTHRYRYQHQHHPPQNTSTLLRENTVVSITVVESIPASQESQHNTASILLLLIRPTHIYARRKCDSRPSPQSDTQRRILRFAYPPTNKARPRGQPCFRCRDVVLPRERGSCLGVSFPSRINNKPDGVRYLVAKANCGDGLLKDRWSPCLLSSLVWKVAGLACLVLECVGPFSEDVLVTAIETTYLGA